MTSAYSPVSATLDGKTFTDNNSQQKRNVKSQYALVCGLLLGIGITIAFGSVALPLLKNAASSRRNATTENGKQHHVWLADGFAGLSPPKNTSTKSTSSSGGMLPMIMKLLSSSSSTSSSSSSSGGFLSMLTGGGGSTASLLPLGLKVMGKAMGIKHRIVTTGTSDKCAEHLDQLITRLIQSGGKDSWALKFFDALGKPPSGLMEGNPWWFGSRDECVAIEPSVSKEGRARFGGRYCLANIGPKQPGVTVEPRHPSLPIGLNWGFCMPRSCMQADFVNFVQNILGELPKAAKMPGQNETTVNWSYCEKTDEEWKLDSSASAVLIVMAIFVALVALGTLLELLRSQRDAFNSDSYTDSATETRRSTSRIVRMILAFSCIENGRKILATTSKPVSTTASAEDRTTLHSLHGIRVLTMAWIIMIHTWLFSPYLFSDVFSGLRKISKSLAMQFIFNGHLAVDSFFVLSGTLLVYLFLHESNKRRNAGISWFQYYFFRFWRLTPAMMVSLGILAGVMPLFLVGPNSYLNETFAPQRCENSWWTNLLYVNNFFRFDQQCAPWTWYLACDTQFYVLAPLVLVPLVRRGTRAGVTVLGGLLAAHMLVVFVTTMTLDVPMEIFGNYLLQDYDQQWKYDRWYYMQPWGRAGPYLIGMMLGLVLYKWRQHQKTAGSPQARLMSGSTAAIGWLLTIGFMLIPLIFTYPMYQHKEPYPTWINALYNTFARTFWALGLSWIIFACETGYGSFVNSFLSWRAFVPLSKLTYCAFLLHVPLISYFTAASMSSSPFSFIVIQFRYCGLLVFTYLASFAFSLVFEAPMMELAKAMFGGSGGGKQNKVRPHSTLPSLAGDEKVEGERVV